jgi:uncharacterized protein YdhG (YjbR/CyaY superfamily)
MDSKNMKCTTIDEYIAAFPADIQKKLQILRKTIKAAAPEAVEKISYGMPAFDYKGTLVYIAAFKDHLSFFPTGSGREVFAAELTDYPGGKGTIQLPFEKPLPLDLISRIVKFRVAENIKKAESKRR